MRGGDTMYDATKQAAKNIYHSLDVSPYDTEYKDWHFRFSTEKHQKKFENDFLKHKEWLDDSMSRRFHIDFDSGMLAAVSLYCRIEGRGFYIYNKKENETYRDPKDVYMLVVM